MSRDMLYTVNSPNRNLAIVKAVREQKRSLAGTLSGVPRHGGRLAFLPTGVTLV